MGDTIIIPENRPFKDANGNELSRADIWEMYISQHFKKCPLCGGILDVLIPPQGFIQRISCLDCGFHISERDSMAYFKQYEGQSVTDESMKGYIGYGVIRYQAREKIIRKTHIKVCKSCGGNTELATTKEGNIICRKCLELLKH